MLGMHSTASTFTSKPGRPRSGYVNAVVTMAQAGQAMALAAGRFVLGISLRMPGLTLGAACCAALG
uniref:Uncharacterized protein n=1 Tax=mine drainage metagenome TaxID=410659 RepID=E6PRB4_9ZZZZ